MVPFLIERAKDEKLAIRSTAKAKAVQKEENKTQKYHVTAQAERQILVTQLTQWHTSNNTLDFFFSTDSTELNLHYFDM